MAKRVYRAGEVFGRLTLVEEVGKFGKSQRMRWLCRCECGRETPVFTSALLSGNTRSCGCLSRDSNAERQITHGLSGTPEYHAWYTAIQRCTNPEYENFEDYGGRGIQFHSAWLEDLPAFLAEVGPRPGPGYSLGRIDNEGHYEPGNLRWETSEQQNNNRRFNRIVTADGKTLSQAAHEAGMTVGNLFRRLKRGLTIEEALAKPVRKQKPRTVRSA
jgi:hypothetical protein